MPYRSAPAYFQLQVVVMTMSLGFIAFVTVLHVVGKVGRSAALCARL